MSPGCLPSMSGGTGTPAMGDLTQRPAIFCYHGSISNARGGTVPGLIESCAATAGRSLIRWARVRSAIAVAGSFGEAKLLWSPNSADRPREAAGSPEDTSPHARSLTLVALSMGPNACSIHLVICQILLRGVLSFTSARKDARFHGCTFPWVSFAEFPVG